jgi:predicted transcriptional regulator
MKTLNVGIATYEEMKARTLAIAKGEIKPKAGDPQVWFPSTESFAKLLSSRNRALLQQIRTDQPESINALATATGRTSGNLSRTLRTMERYGLVQLHRGSPGHGAPRGPLRRRAIDDADLWKVCFCS